MNRFFSFLVVLVLTPFANADYYKLYTQVLVTPKLGNIVVMRGIAREAKYVDYMTDHREEMAKENIFPDADLGTYIENTVVAVMDDQKIEIVVHSDHRRMHGAGCAIADNYIEIKVDGKKVYESTFGARGVYKIVLLPLERNISVYKYPHEKDHSWQSTFWYDNLSDGQFFYLLAHGTSWVKEVDSTQALLADQWHSKNKMADWGDCVRMPAADLEELKTRNSFRCGMFLSAD